MAFLTFAEAKVVAPPIVPLNKQVNSDRIPDLVMMTHYDAIPDPVMMTQYDTIVMGIINQ